MALQPSYGYLRSPSIGGDTIVFITDDDVWSVPADGGSARRVTADLLGIAHPVVSPDARLVAFTSEAQGQPEIYVAPVAGGMARRLTWLGSTSRIGATGNPKALCWTADRKLVFASDTGQPFSSLTMAYTVSEEGEQPPALLPFGPVRDVSYGPAGGVVIGRNSADPALWKRYRGGTAGSIWIDRKGTGELPAIASARSRRWQPGFADVGGRTDYFLSDHEGIGNLYSCSPVGDDIKRHTDHEDHYARLAASDGNRIVYQVAARLWLYEPSTDRSHEIPVEVGHPRTQRQPRFVSADQYLSGYQLDRAGKRLVLSAGKTVQLRPVWWPRRPTWSPPGCALPAEQLPRR